MPRPSITQSGGAERSARQRSLCLDAARHLTWRAGSDDVVDGAKESADIRHALARFTTQTECVWQQVVATRATPDGSYAISSALDTGTMRLGDIAGENKVGRAQAGRVVQPIASEISVCFFLIRHAPLPLEGAKLSPMSIHSRVTADAITLDFICAPRQLFK